MNHVRLVPKANGCEMQVVSNYSGWGHDDKSDFRKRVDDALMKIKAVPAEAAKSPTAITAQPARPRVQTKAAGLRPAAP